MKINPLIDIAILIPCYNNYEGLITSINSINYHIDRCLLLIVDDGSHEPITNKLISSGLERGMNFKILRLNNNAGITKSLNFGLDYIYDNLNIKYIARLDCGDICAPSRFNTQVSYLESNKDIDLIGSWCHFKNADSTQAYKFSAPTKHKDIMKSIYFKNVFIHPTVMWRQKEFDNIKYPEIYPHAEDYGLFFSMILKLKSAIINEYLVTCEINPNGISLKNRKIQLKSRLKVISYYSTNKLLFLLGAIKLKLLLLLPYRIIFVTKKLLYKI